MHKDLGGDGGARWWPHGALTHLLLRGEGGALVSQVSTLKQVAVISRVFQGDPRVRNVDLILE